MNYKEMTRLDLVEGGTAIRQGEHFTLAFTPRDYTGEDVDLTGKNIAVVLASGRGIEFETTGTFDATEKVIRFTVKETIAAGEMWLDMTVTDPNDVTYRRKFPTNAYEGRINFIPSTDNLNVAGVTYTTVAKLESDIETKFSTEVMPPVNDIKAKQTQLDTQFNEVLNGVTQDGELLAAHIGPEGQFDTIGKRMDNTAVKLADKVGDGVKAKMEDLDDEVISAVTGGATVNVLSIPQDESTNYKKLASDLQRAIDENIVNLYDPLLAVDKAVPSYANGTYQLVSYSDTSIALGKQEVSPGQTFTLSIPSTENGFDRVLRCYDANLNYLGLSEVVGANPVASGITVSTITTAKERKQASVTLTAGTAIRFIDTSILYPHAAHTDADFQRIRNSVQFEVGTSFSAFQVFGTHIPKIRDEALPASLDTLKSDVNTLKASAGASRDMTAVIIDGNNLAVRVKWDEANDMFTLWNIDKGIDNRNLNMVGHYTLSKDAPLTQLTGTTFKAAPDDVTPLQLNIGYLGANHGYDSSEKITMTGHGKTSADIGSVWNHSTDGNFILMEVIDANTLLVLYDFSGLTAYVRKRLTNASGTLTHVSGATNTSNIVYATKAGQQFRPNINNKVISFWLDGKEISADGVYQGLKFDLIERYDITSLAGISAYAKANAGSPIDLMNPSIPPMIGISNVFSHGRNGSITVTTGYSYHEQTSIIGLGIVQSQVIGNKAYVPDVGTVSGLNLSNVVTQGTDTLNFYPSTWLDAAKPPYRYHQFNDDLSKGMALGYNTQIGLGKPAIRVSSHGGNFVGSSKKMYPAVRTGTVIAQPGNYDEAVAFRMPLRKIDPDATALYWYWVGDDVYLAFDYHKNIDKIIQLPNYLAGKKIEKLDIHANTTVQSEVVSAIGIKVKVVNNYGFGVLRLYD